MYGTNEAVGCGAGNKMLMPWPSLVGNPIKARPGSGSGNEGQTHLCAMPGSHLD